jgi:hypothetical protein
MRRAVAVAALATAALLVPVAVAATPGTYTGSLYKASGERWSGTPTTMYVYDRPQGQRFTLSSYNMRLTCPYLDRYGRQARARFRFVHRGVVEGSRIDDTRDYPRTNPTHRVRIRGTFVGRRFGGRVRVTSAPGITGACTGSVRVRVSR